MVEVNAHGWRIGRRCKHGRQTAHQQESQKKQYLVHAPDSTRPLATTELLQRRATLNEKSGAESMLDNNARLLLISTSTVYGTGYLDHAESEIVDHLRGIRNVLFIPYALKDYDAYAGKACDRFGKMGFQCESIHRSESPKS